MGKRRWIHRQGALFEAVFVGDGGEQPALVRISTTFGWPAPLPDWVGLGIRLLGTNGDAELDFDLLLASAAPEPDLWTHLRPSRDVLACAFTSAVRYIVDGTEPHVVAAVPTDGRSASLAELMNGAAHCPIHYRLQTGDEPGSWERFGELTLRERLGDDPSLRFHPPAEAQGMVATFRRWVYARAQD